MKDKHGSLESEILNAIWHLEETANGDELYISVNRIFQILNENNSSRAYTTIKTVMDRLVEKGLLERTKTGKKFCYTSVSTRNEMAKEAIQKLARQYFRNDMKLMMKAIEKESLHYVY